MSYENTNELLLLGFVMTMTYDKIMELIRKLNKQCKNKIIMRLSDSQLENLKYCGTAYYVWKARENIYVRKSTYI